MLTSGSLAAQVAQFRRHAGGWIRPGRAWTSWIHIADEVGLIVFALRNDQAEGPLNATAPHPVANRDFARTLGQVVGHRAWLPIPASAAAMGLGVVADILTRGKRVVPEKTCSLGYQFRYPELETALRELLGHGTGAGLPGATR